MRSLILSCLGVVGAVSCAASATPVDDFREGMDATFQVSNAVISSTGAAEIMETVTDAQPFCVPKARGTLDIELDLANIGFPTSLPVTLTGVPQSDTTVRWSASIDVNQCLEAMLPDGSTVNFLIRDVTVVLTGEIANSPATPEDLCIARRGLTITTVGGDAGNAIDVTAYALCLQVPFSRVDIDVREIVAGGLGGDDPCPGDTNSDNTVNFADLNTVLSQFGAQAAPAELAGDVNLDGVVGFGDLNTVLSAFGGDCSAR